MAASSAVVTDCATATGAVLAAGADVPIVTLPFINADSKVSASTVPTSRVVGSSTNITSLLLPVAPIALKDIPKIFDPSARSMPNPEVSSQETVNFPVAAKLVA